MCAQQQIIINNSVQNKKRAKMKLRRTQTQEQTKKTKAQNAAEDRHNCLTCVRRVWRPFNDVVKVQNVVWVRTRAHKRRRPLLQRLRLAQQPLPRHRIGLTHVRCLATHVTAHTSTQPNATSTHPHKHTLYSRQIHGVACTCTGENRAHRFYPTQVGEITSLPPLHFKVLLL